MLLFLCFIFLLHADSCMLMQGGSSGAVQEQVNLATSLLWNLLKLFEISKIDFVVWSQVLIRKIIELHDKYMEYVTNCFINHTLFHKVCGVWYSNGL